MLIVFEFVCALIVVSSLFVLSWNVRGLGKFEKIRDVYKVFESNRVNLIMLRETKVSEISGYFQRRLKGKFDRELAFALAEGASGGLISLWDRNVYDESCKIIFRRMIALKGRLVSNNREIGVINVYGPNVQGEMREFFEQLITVISDWNIPVIVGGDFNAVRMESERLEVQVQSTAMEIFEEFITASELFEVPNLGSLFTWFRGDGNVVASRLDRFLISTEIFSLFPQLMQVSLPRRLSDHKPIVLKESRLKIIRPFKWFNYWADDPILAKTIRELCEFNRGKGMNKILLLVKKVTKSEISVLKASLWAVMRKEEWLQKSRLRWFKEGDKNTKFFHLSAVTRGRKNHITKLKVQNSVVKNQAKIQQAFVNYFHDDYNEYKTIPLKRFDIPFKKINAATRRIMESLFSEEEKVEAISPDESRPISLVGSLYKNVSRVLAKRLGSCLAEVIVENQFAFIVGKQIADCSLIANKVIDGLSKRKKEAVLIKADFSKANDTVDWWFLNLILKKMGFGRR
ncbi:uncharacterized protein LOC120118823 [Hibiscus syriacus]|uniref:uncharacterized protein LOC120118823 n=1 Tax=Hibiscus syriacus TaxID=106335 RepID=UPI001920474F|nr:uncharacterized protein LOC120118823 [Hibiscus syriacus]